MRHPVHQYAEDVVEGRIVTGKPVLWACQRHLGDLEASEADPEYLYEFDEDAADSILDFSGLVHHFEGEWAGKPLELQPWQQFVFGSIYGWLKRADGARRFTEALVFVARKNGKSLMAVVPGFYMLLADGEPGAQCFSFASSLKQVDKTVHRAVVQVRRHSPEIKAKTMEKAGEILSVDDPAAVWAPLADAPNRTDGLGAHFACADELAQQSGGLYQAVQGSSGARRQPLIFAITTAGEDPEGFGGQMFDFHHSNLDPRSGVSVDSAFAYLAVLDIEDDPDEPENWVKANPMLGISKKPEWMTSQQAKAKAMPSLMPTFRTKHLNIWSDRLSQWLDMDDWDTCTVTTEELPSLRDERAVVGVDLSSNTDLTAVIMVFYELEPMPVIPFFFYPEENLKVAAKRDRVPYQVWADEGHIITTPGNVIDYDFVIHTIEQASRDHQITEIAFDPHNAMQFSTHLGNVGFKCVRIEQTFGVLHEPSIFLETSLAKGALVIAANPVFRWNASVAGVTYNAAREIKPDKTRKNKRIDGVAALVNALRRVMYVGAEVNNTEIPAPQAGRQRAAMEFFNS